MSTPPDYIPTEPIINYDEVDVTVPADSIETRIANLQKILEDIKALKLQIRVI